MAWVALDLFKEYARETQATNDTIYQWALDAGHQWASNFTQRTFDVASGTPAARSYTPNSSGLSVLRIHDCVSITSVVDNGTTIVAGDRQSQPVNNLNPTGLTVPFEEIRRYGGSWTFDQGFARIVVTADWGWATTPASVTEATLIISKDFLQQRNNNSGVAGFGDMGAVRVRSNPEALKLLQPYRRVESWGIA